MSAMIGKANSILKVPVVELGFAISKAWCWRKLPGESFG